MLLIEIIVTLIVVVWLLSVFGILGRSGDIKVPQVR